MSQIESTTMRTVIMDLIKTKFSGYAFWRRIEPEVALMCSDLQEPTSEEKKTVFIEKLEQIKVFFLEQEVVDSDLEFLQDEIDRFKETRTMSLFEEDDDTIEKDIIEMYSRLGQGTEGVVGIHHAFNYIQLGKLTNAIFRKTNLIKFYISREKTIYGKIVAEIYEHAQKIPVAILAHSKKKDKETGLPVEKRVFMFGEKIEKNRYNKIKEVNVPFFVYRFITEDNNEMILISSDKCDIGDYIVTGVITQCDDLKTLTDSARLPTKLPFFFAENVRNRIIKYKNHNELMQKLNNMGVTKGTFFDYPFTISANNNSYVLLQPLWYKWLIWAWNTHQKKGLFNNYPMHIMVVGPKHSGKSLLLNGLHSKSKENKDIFSGSSSTLKSLIPSFRHNPASLGYLAEANRFAYCDEFFRAVRRDAREEMDESVALMNDLLEHQKREAGSGVSRINVNMTARILATTNPIKGNDSVSDMIKTFDESFLSRWLIYHQTRDHINLIRNSRDSDLKPYLFRVDKNDWVSILDYLQTFSAKYDLDEVDKVKKSVIPLLNETLARHYDARHNHHIECLIDGIVKTRCILEKDTSFTATKKDYETLELVWSNVIRSWIDNTDIKRLPIKMRKNYVPENSRYVFDIICNHKRPILRDEILEKIGVSITKVEFYESIAILEDNQLIKQEGGYYLPYYMGEDDTNQQRLQR